MTFIGFNVSDNGDLIDPITRKVTYKKLLSSELMRGLKVQKVTLNDDNSNDQ